MKLLTLLLLLFVTQMNAQITQQSFTVVRTTIMSLKDTTTSQFDTDFQVELNVDSMICSFTEQGITKNLVIEEIYPSKHGETIILLPNRILIVNSFYTELHYFIEAPHGHISFCRRYFVE